MKQQADHRNDPRKVYRTADTPPELAEMLIVELDKRLAGKPVASKQIREEKSHGTSPQAEGPGHHRR